MNESTFISEIEEIMTKCSCTSCGGKKSRCDSNCCKNCLVYDDDRYPEYSKCERLRWHYMLRYFWAHYKEIENLLKRLPRSVMDGLKENSSFQIDSIGGGPGIDLLSIINWIKETTNIDVTQLKGMRVDRVEDWMKHSVKIFDMHELNGFKRSFRTIDAFEYFPQKETRVISISYLLSELINQKGREKTIKWLKDVIASASKGSVVLLNDRPEESIRSVIMESIAPNVARFAHREGLSRGKLSENGFNIHERCHIGYSIPDGKRAHYQSKLYCTSIQLTAFI